MDTQLKKGILDICVLKYLEKETSYGYNIIEQLKNLVSLSESTLYPILKRLELEECVTTYKEEHQGRLRKYYKITEKGRKKIKEFKNEWKEIKKIYDFILEGIVNE